ncbi:MAG TPA: ATP-binding protein [Gemmataceae bacterium]|nr:ATP-binding protein [Gemmataceae bacterium]
MRRSIRGRLQAWYGLVLAAAIAGYASYLYLQAHAARLQEVDTRLEAAVNYLDVNLRRFPLPELEGQTFDRPFPPRPTRERPPHPPRPPRPGRDRLLAELTLSRGSEQADQDRRFAGVYFVVWRSDGTVLKTASLPDNIPLPYVSRLVGPPQTQLRQRGEFREGLMRGPGGTTILVGKTVHKDWADLRAFGWQLTGAGLAVLGIGLAGGWLISARIFRPVAAISATATAISATSLSERIDTDNIDVELAGLAKVLNAMFGRLEAAFERQARFTADASHELRTPLAIIRNHAELALARERPAEEYREAIEACLRASGRMTALVDGLLTLARADAGKLGLQLQAVDLRQLIEESVELFRRMAESKGLTLEARLAPAEVTGDPASLAQVVTNFLSNAVRYNRPTGAIRVELSVTDGEALFAVADTGCGIPVEDRPYLFERFYRVDKARSRASGGNGLGLAICKSIVEAHGGAIGFETELECGSRFWVRLPCLLSPA